MSGLEEQDAGRAEPRDVSEHQSPRSPPLSLSCLPTEAEHLVGLLSFPLLICLGHPVAEVRNAGLAHGLLRISY